MFGSPVPMVPLPGVGACVLECFLRFELLLRKRDRDIELERSEAKSARSAFQVRSSIQTDFKNAVLGLDLTQVYPRFTLSLAKRPASLGEGKSGSAKWPKSGVGK